MRFEHRPQRALLPPAFDDALLETIAAGCPNCRAPVHPETVVVARYRAVVTVACVACVAPRPP